QRESKAERQAGPHGSSPFPAAGRGPAAASGSAGQLNTSPGIVSPPAMGGRATKTVMLMVGLMPWTEPSPNTKLMFPPLWRLPQPHLQQLALAGVTRLTHSL